MHGHTHCMGTLVMYTHDRAVANVCLSVCLALRRAVLISVKQHMALCCTVCGRMYSAFALSVVGRSTHLRRCSARVCVRVCVCECECEVKVN